MKELHVYNGGVPIVGGKQWTISSRKDPRFNWSHAEKSFVGNYAGCPFAGIEQLPLPIQKYLRKKAKELKCEVPDDIDWTFTHAT